MSKDAAKLIAQSITTLTAASLSAAIGGSQGAALAAAVDANNRQLHPTEAKLIKNNAGTYAARRGISVEQANAELTQQAMQQFDSAWDVRLGSDNKEAQAFLKEIGTGQQMIDSLTGQKFQLFTADEATRNNHAMFAQYAKTDPVVSRELNLAMNQAYKPKDAQTLDLRGMTGSDMALNDAARDYANMKAQPAVVQTAVLGELRATRQQAQTEYAQLAVKLSTELTATERGQVMLRMQTLEERDQALLAATKYQIQDMSAAGLIKTTDQREWTEGFGSALGAARLGTGLRASIGARIDALKGAAEEAKAASAAERAVVQAKIENNINADLPNVYDGQKQGTYNNSLPVTRMVYNGVEVHPSLPPPAAGYGYSPLLVKGATTDNQLYSQWTGFQSEIRLANEVAGMGQTVVKWGDVVGRQGNDVISVVPNTGEVVLWDSKFRSNPTNVGQSPTFANAQTRANAIEEAAREIRQSNLPSSTQEKAIQNLRDGNFTTNTVGAGNVKNSVQIRYCSGIPC